MPTVFASDFYQVNNGENAFKLVQILNPLHYGRAAIQSYKGASGMHLSHIELKVHNNST